MDPREIQELEELCVQDEAAFCQAACPLHVDVRAVLTAIARGDFGEAAKVYAKRAPLARILSRVCDEPCRAVCKRGEAGDAINLQLLERCMAENASFAVEGIRPGSAKKERVAVVGGGLSGMSAASELARKGYAVTLFEAESRLGGRARLFPAGQLPPKYVDEEVDLLELAKVEFKPGRSLGRDVRLPDLLEQYDAVYVATGCESLADPVVAALAASVDPVSLATNSDKVFLGGSARRAGEAYSPVMSISDGCRAATSIDRLFKQESLVSRREREGPYDTRLFTSVEGIGPESAVTPEEPTRGYSAAEARTEAARCIQCECMECVKACTYLDHFREYPGKCIRKVTKNIISVPGKSFRTYTKFINACSLCGLCGVVCPTDLNMAVVNSEARRIMTERGLMPPAIHEFALTDMKLSSSEPYGFARNQPGHDSSSYLFFPGCQVAASAPGNVERTYRFLTERLQGGVALMLRCCGAPALWAGRQEAFRTMLDGFRHQWESLGRPQVILACPTCHLMFRREMSDVPAVSLWTILDREGLPGNAPPGEGRVLAVHDSCTARFARGTQDAVRNLLVKLGYQLEELHYSRESTKCCGYGGLMYLVNPELTKKVVVSRVGESPSDYVTYCTNCRDFFAGEAKPAFHMLDLLFEGHPGPAPARPGPTLSQRRDNRRYLAKRMLDEFWGVSMVDEAPHAGLRLRIPEEIQTRMEKEFILADDLRRVIHEGESTGDKLYLPESGHFVAHFRPSLVTYWVEYQEHEGEYRVFNTYSHRMRIVESARCK